MWGQGWDLERRLSSKSTGCSLRGPGFVPAPTQQLTDVTPVSGDLTPSSGLPKALQEFVWCTDTHSQKNLDQAGLRDPSCLCLLSAGVKGVRHHTWLKHLYIKETPSLCCSHLYIKETLSLCCWQLSQQMLTVLDSCISVTCIIHSGVRAHFPSCATRLFPVFLSCCSLFSSSSSLSSS